MEIRKVNHHLKVRIRRHTISFKNAFNGIKYAFSSQPNFTIHLLAAILVFLGGLFFDLTRGEILILIFLIFFVFVTELFNTAMETTVDLITDEWKLKAKIAKDLTAAAVLTAAIGTAIVGIIIFWPHLVAFLK